MKLQRSLKNGRALCTAYKPSACSLLMWMRLLATTRIPSCSKRSMILPVILRLVAFGLMIEKVRSMAMDSGSPLIALAGDCLAGDCSGWAQPLGAAGGAVPPKLHFAPGL